MIRSRRNHLAESPIASAFTKESSMSVFEQEIRQVFDFALLNSGYGNMQPWIRLRRAVKDLFMSLESAEGTALYVDLKQFSEELGRTYGLFIWAYDRQIPDDKAHLSHFVTTFSPSPWESLLGAEPQHPLDCYHALPLQSGYAFLVVAKSGILMAQRDKDFIAEGLLWGALAEMTLLNYDRFPLEARNALDRLLDCGTEVLLMFPNGFDPFAAPFQQLDHLLRTLTDEELQDFVLKLDDAYGEKFSNYYGSNLAARLPSLHPRK